MLVSVPGPAVDPRSNVIPTTNSQTNVASSTMVAVEQNQTATSSEACLSVKMHAYNGKVISLCKGDYL